MGTAFPRRDSHRKRRGAEASRSLYIILGTERHSIRFKKGKIFIMFGLISPQSWLGDGRKKLPVWYMAISTGACFTDLLLKSEGREGALCV